MFYFKRERKEEKTIGGESPIFPIIGKIIIGNSIAQFGTKLKTEERLWHVKSGRAMGKSNTAASLNHEGVSKAPPVKIILKKAELSQAQPLSCALNCLSWSHETRQCKHGI